jgi:hypothetical protein
MMMMPRHMWPAEDYEAEGEGEAAASCRLLFIADALPPPLPSSAIVSLISRPSRDDDLMTPAVVVVRWRLRSRRQVCCPEK